VVAELGGKNCVIVDADADLDETIPAIVYSAFAYAGQKCSAASRVLVHEAISEALLERLAGAVRTLVVGQAQELGTDVPPVIERSARDRIDRYSELAARQGRIVARAQTVPDRGWFCPPTVVSELAADSPVLAEEVFGPLLAVQSVAGVADACDLVDELPFALTGGLFARDPATVRYVRERTPVGNLYVNRGITGAMVARQPFGVTENTMRHGLVV
jgi:RHH-type proline utilization regulon transcriptional repressor/proline dehydrogenase/delta 1-pyrroline-5-carboxylate dehydrogenase